MLEQEDCVWDLCRVLVTASPTHIIMVDHFTGRVI